MTGDRTGTVHRTEFHASGDLPDFPCKELASPYFPGRGFATWHRFSGLPGDRKTRIFPWRELGISFKNPNLYIKIIKLINLKFTKFIHYLKRLKIINQL